jgi:L-ascorbate metabolism protein UlaG (beta-lactamase superfamily)
MRRRQFMQSLSLGVLTTLGVGYSSQVFAQKNANEGVLIQYLGHTCFFVTGGGMRILINPFRAIGCTAGYKLPKVEADLVLISSQLWDEGAAENLPGNPKVLYEPGVYTINGFELQGIGVPHDRKGGVQFGTNVVWRWTQAGLKILHLGGAAAPIELEQKILMGTPDIAFIPVGGGVKAYNPEEAKQAMEILKPKIMIPTQYLTAAADKNNCDIVGVDSFLKLVQGMNVRQIPDNQLRVKAKDLPKEGTLIRVLEVKKVLKS